MLCLGAISVLFAAGPATAQSLVAGQGVADRPRPDFDPIGARAGSYTLLPSITTTMEATDNYLATDTNRRSDIYLLVQPEVYLRSNFARNRLDARAFLNQSVHANLGGENTTQYGGSASGAYDIDRSTQVTANVSAARYTESRSSLGSFQGSASPVTFTDLSAGVGVSHTFDKLTLRGGGAIDYRNFSDTAFPDGTPIDQDYRDVATTTGSGSASYAWRNGVNLIVSGQYSSEQYRVRPGQNGFIPGVNIDRDSDGFNIQGGVNLELSHLIYGSVQVGYLTRNYNDPTLRDFSGLSFSGDILWNVTPLTSLRFRASRSVEDTSSPLIAGNTRSDFRVSIDHELYRYIIISGEAAYGRFRPNGIGIGGDEYLAGASGRYLLSRRFSLTAAARYSSRTADSTFLRYRAVTGSVGLRTQF